jgi:putative RNA 2'-phosphotransferase
MLTYLLGHRPDEFGLVLDADGFVSMKQVLQVLAGEPGWGFVRRHHLEEVAALLEPPRFEVKGEMLRGLPPAQGNLRRPPGETPPALLYAAIPPRAHAGVWQEGLKPPGERELVLATTAALALKLGRRRSPEPVLVTVQAQAAARAGIDFQGYGEDLFLAPVLPREFLQLPSPPEKQEKAQPARPGRPPPTPGSVILDLPQFFAGGSRERRPKDEPPWKSGARALRKKRRRGE